MCIRDRRKPLARKQPVQPVPVLLAPGLYFRKVCIPVEAPRVVCRAVLQIRQRALQKMCIRDRLQLGHKVHFFNDLPGGNVLSLIHIYAWSANVHTSLLSLICIVCIVRNQFHNVSDITI